MSSSRTRLLLSGEVDEATSDLCRNLGDAIELVRAGEVPTTVDGILLPGDLSRRSADLRVCAQGFLDSVPDGLVLVNEEGVIAWHNTVFTEQLGTAEPLVGQHFSTVLNGDREALARLENRWPGRTHRSCRVTIPLEDRRYIEAFAAPAELSDPDGQPVAWVSICVRDVTQKELSRLKLEAIHQAGVHLADVRPDEVAEMSMEDRVEILKENILTFSQELLGFDTIELRVLNPSTGQLTPLVEEGMQDEAACRLLYAQEEDNGITGYVAATGNSYLCPDTQAEARYLRGAQDARSSITVPLKLDDLVLGTFNVESPGADSFDEADLEFLEHYSAVVALALNQLQLMMAEKATTAEQHAKRLQRQVACPTDEILADATSILEEYIGHDPNVSETLHRILGNVRKIRSCISHVSEEEFPADTGVPQPQLNERRRPALAGRRVLVVDADELIRAEAHTLLDPQGCQVEAVDCGAAGCRMMRSQTYDVVLTDIRLPDMTGFECFCRMKDIDTHTPIIFMTGFGYDASHSIVKARQLGLKAVLYKPFRVEQLMTEVEKAVLPPAPHE